MPLWLKDSSVKFKEVKKGFLSLFTSRTFQIAANNFSWRIHEAEREEREMGQMEK